MERELIIDVTTSEIAIALLEDRRLVELTKENVSSNYSVGDIYLGKVKRILPALNAAFIDVGNEKDAFLHYFDLGFHFNLLNSYVKKAQQNQRPVVTAPKSGDQILPKGGKITDVLTQGQAILVQIVKESISTKGPRLTAEISIAGRNLVLLPFSDKVSISQKIEQREERKRMERLVRSIIPQGFGVIVRTVAEGKKTATLAPELNALIKRWESCADKIRSSRPPQLLVSEINRTSAILRDMLNVTYNNIYVNDTSLYEEIKEYVGSIAPEQAKIVKLYTGKDPIFERFNISKQIRGSFGKYVSLRNGAYMIMEQTEALHVIDVNSGRTRGVKTQEEQAIEVNMVAATEVARQLRLRDIGGIIVVDFIDMDKQENRNKLFTHMRTLMENDRARHNVLPLSKFGLMQMTRQRVRPATQINNNEQCPACRGTGKIIPSILFDEMLQNQLVYLTQEKKIKHLTLKLHPYMAVYLNSGIISRRRRWAWQNGCRLRIKATNSYALLEHQWFDKNGDKIII
ncbi:MAG: Rne/Rng family ribonuclease [Prevotellaceae bacterium]|jgi:ribonuclease G|nr:Rne/Rng family ribonuclease [Prevotellaceae bacterium]